MYNQSYQSAICQIKENLKEFYANPSSAYCTPFKILNNLYYVGDKRVCAHLIDTGNGLILFDAGYHHTFKMLINSISELGFNPKDIKYLILSHGHFDHFGACNKLREIYGVKSFLNKADCEMISKNPSATLIELGPYPNEKMPIIDFQFDDGDIIKLGNTEIECVTSAGHSPGTTSFFFNIEENGKTYKVGYFGGTGFLTLYKDFLNEYKLSLDLQDEFKNSINKLKKRRVDIVLGNHPSQNSTFNKFYLMKNGTNKNPFINENEWNEMLNLLQKQYEVFLKKGY